VPASAVEAVRELTSLSQTHLRIKGPRGIVCHGIVGSVAHLAHPLVSRSGSLFRILECSPLTGD